MTRPSLNRTATQTSTTNVSRAAYIGIAIVGIAIAAAWDWLTGGIGPQLILGTTEVTLTSTPADADVLIDGVPVGKTPLVAEGVLAGERIVRFEHPFHEPIVRRYSAERGQPGNVDVTFEPITTTLLIASNPKGASVTFNGVPVDGEAPVEVETSTGRHEVRFDLAGRESATIFVEVVPGDDNEVSVDLERKPMGTLLLELEPATARVRVDGSNYLRGMRLPQGEHSVVVSAPGFLTSRRTIDIIEGLNQHAFSLATAISRLTIATNPANAEVVIQAGGQRTTNYEGPIDVPFGTVKATVRAKDHRTFRTSWNINNPRTTKRVTLERQTARPGEQFSDALASGGMAPQVLVIGSGSFTLGTDNGPPDEGPGRTIEFLESFALGAYEVTRGDFARFDPNVVVDSETASLPAVSIEWETAIAYTQWLSRETGERYRLPTEAEWEYAARGGTTTELYEAFEGPRLDGVCRFENVRDQSMREYARTDAVICNDGFKELAPVGQFQPNPWGLFDMMGNVSEWVANCWLDRHPRPRVSAGPISAPICHTWTARGGSWLTPSQDLRVTLRVPGGEANVRRGFRVLREL